MGLVCSMNMGYSVGGADLSMQWEGLMHVNDEIRLQCKAGTLEWTIQSSTNEQ